MSVLDRLDGEFPHGLPAGFDQGCRGGGECPNRGTELPICRDAWSRYRSDWSYRKLVDRGLSPAEIFAEENAAVLADRVVVAEARQAAAVKAEQVRVAAEERARSKLEREAAAEEKSRAREQARVEREAAKEDRTRAKLVRDHEKADRERAKLEREILDRAATELAAALDQKIVEATPQLTVRGARAAVRAAGLVVERAREALRDAEQAAADAAAELDRLLSERKVKPAPRPRVVQPHGTNASYARGCRCQECRDAAREYHREWMRRRKQKPIPAEYHGTAYGNQLGCTDREACPASPSCAEVVRAEDRRRRREQGIPERVEMVPAGPVRAHVRELMAAGIPLLTVAERAGVSKSAAKALIYGRSDRPARVQETISVENASRLMAVRP